VSNSRLKRGLDAIERVPVPVTWDDIERRLPNTPEPTQLAAPDPVPVSPDRPDRRRLATAAAVAAVAAVIAAVVWQVPAPAPVGTGPATTAEHSAPPGTPTSSSSTSTTTSSPMAGGPRSSAAIAASTDALFVWGGKVNGGVRQDGFTVDAATGAVRAIPAAPIGARSAPTGVWTGRELIVCCGFGSADGSSADTRSAAAWDPAAGTWRTLARPPASVARSFPASVWTGNVMVVVATGPAAATYDPATDRWVEIQPPPQVDRRPEAVWTGSEMIVWDARYGSGRHPAPVDEVADRGWRWAPGRDHWDALPDLPPGYRIQLGGMGWTGTEIVVWGQSITDETIGVGARWTPGQRQWRPMRASPFGTVEAFDGTAGSQAVMSDPTHRRVLVRGLQGDAEVAGNTTPALFTYDPATDNWTATDLRVPGYHPTLTVSGDRLFAPDSDNPLVGAVPP
jgi:hypothetical protein